MDGVVNEFVKRAGELNTLSELEPSEIAEKGGFAERLAQNWAQSRKDKIKMTQLRKLFDEVKRYERNFESRGWDSISSDFHMLRPKLAFAVGRGIVPKGFYEVVSTCIDKIASNQEMRKESFYRFRELLEAIVAYYKYEEEVKR